MTPEVQEDDIGPIDPAQECQELLGALSEQVTVLREAAARGDEDAAALVSTVRDTLYTELMVVRGMR